MQNRFFVLLSSVIFLCLAVGVNAQTKPLGGQPAPGTKPSVKDLDEQVDYQGALEAVVWSEPAVGIYGIRRGMFALGIKDNEIMAMSRPLTTRHEFLTANNTTPYIAANADLRNGPVLEVPPASAQINSLYETDDPPAPISSTSGPGYRQGVKTQQVGRSYAQQVEMTSKLITDPVIVDYVNGIGQNLAHNSDTQVQLTIKIVDRGEVNAFWLSGGFIFVDSGLILVADTEAELAAVISHEIAHAAAGHAGQAVAREELTNSGSMPLIFRLAARPLTLNTIYPKRTPNFEPDADSLALEYLYKAGYDPRALLSILEKVKAIEKQKSGKQACDFESHSLITHRIGRTRQNVKRLRLPPAQEYKVDTFDFREIKERLSELNGQKLSDDTSSSGHMR